MQRSKGNQRPFASAHAHLAGADMHAFFRMPFLVTALLTLVGCTTNKVVRDYETYDTEARLPSPQYEEIFEALPQLLKLRNAQVLCPRIIAWALKEDDDRPPGLCEEAVVTFQLQTPTSTNWVIACVHRDLTGYFDFAPGEWRGSDPFSQITSWNKLFPGAPSIEDIIAFTKGTNFGYNECHSEVKVMRLVCYEPSKRLVRSLKAGIPTRERDRRSTSGLIE
jgi:hypothetical protein